VLDEQQTSAGFQHAAHFCERGCDLRNAAGGPRRHDRVDAAIGERDVFGGTREKLNIGLRASRSPPGACQQPRRRIQPENLFGVRRVKRQIQAGADTDFKNAALRCARHALPIGTKVLVAHREIDQRGQDPVLVKSHFWLHMAKITAAAGLTAWGAKADYVDNGVRSLDPSPRGNIVSA
jgi:hypothetical protein